MISIVVGCLLLTIGNLSGGSAQSLADGFRRLFALNF
jgi:hypothetical protein